MAKDTEDKCQYNKCKEPSEIVYLKKGLCGKHWIKICEMTIEEAWKKLEIKEEVTIFRIYASSMCQLWVR